MRHRRTRTSSGPTTTSIWKPTSTSAIRRPERHSDSVADDYDRYAAASRSLGIDLTRPQHDRLLRYAALLREWNDRINIISRGDTGRIISYHATDSIAAQCLVPQSALVCDLGSGGGLPGIPLSIVRPDLSVVLVESSRKRGLFLSAAISELGLERVRLVNERAEQCPPLNCDVIASRLTGRLPDVIEAAAHHIRPGGSLVLYKTRACQPELDRAASRISRLGLAISEQRDVPLPFCGITRRFVVLTRAA